MKRRRFNIATEEEIRAGRVTDVYFERSRSIIEARRADKVVVGEMRSQSLPEEWHWAVLAGNEEVAHLLEGLDVRAWAVPEGTLFGAGDPVLTIQGPIVPSATWRPLSWA